ncbi:MAG: methylmalonyl Co-A mutase-associated GTPase MeaB [Bacteroidia bacterium]|nr:methylmalonyl Co-A mutase-associated GTPase MeaB [Bacteroidia bacterium]
MNTEILLKEILNGNWRALAKAITLVENETKEGKEILSGLKNRDIQVVGITGPPGAGKSTLISALITTYTEQGKKVGVMAVDPTSPFSHGSLLGDRLRMSEHFTHPDVFIRSLATRGSLGGLSSKAAEVISLMKACNFDVILVETVGVGQSEIEIAALADTTVLVLVPEAGDDIQTIKSGVMEIADIFVVNKSDREGADILMKNLEVLVHERPDASRTPAVLKCSATQKEGIRELCQQIIAHYPHRDPDKKEKVRKFLNR